MSIPANGILMCLGQRLKEAPQPVLADARQVFGGTPALLLRVTDRVLARFYDVGDGEGDGYPCDNHSQPSSYHQQVASIDCRELYRIAGLRRFDTQQRET
jgi:hypothetical protein